MEHIMKKFLSLILTVAMCISIIIPAAASEADEVAEMYEMEALRSCTNRRSARIGEKIFGLARKRRAGILTDFKRF